MSTPKTIKCTSCKKEISNMAGTVIFKCPECGTEIIRCTQCRIDGIKYTCPKCGFEGP